MADTLINGTTVYIDSNHPASGPFGPFWVSPSIGVIVYEDSGNDILAQKTTDGGATYGTAVVLTTDTGAGVTARFSCWFDQQTPGDTGDLVHVVVGGSLGDRLVYANYDISANTWSTTTGIVGTDATETGIVTFITKTRSGLLIAGYSKSGVASGAFLSTTGGTSWGAIANPFESHAADYVQGLSVNTGDNDDAAILFTDIDADQFSVKMYDKSGDTWTETAIATVADIGTSVFYDVTTRLSDGHSILVFHNATNTAGNDMECWDLNLNSIASPTVTALANVLTDVTEAGAAGIVIDQGTGDLYAVYATGTDFNALVQMFYKVSTDDGTSWGVQTALSEDAEDDLRSVGAGAAGLDGGRFQPIWFNDDLNDVYNNLNTDLEFAPPVANPFYMMGMAS